MTNIGKRIRLKREELGITQEELAKLLGYRNKSTIAKIENGTNDITQSKVVEFANVLHTTVAFLMGWVDSQEKTETGFVLTELEKQIILEFRKSDEITQEMVLRVLSINNSACTKGDEEKMA